MKFSYLMYEPVPDLNELYRRMELIASLGYQGIELVATHPFGYDFLDLFRFSHSHGLPVVSLLSGWSYANEGLCLCSPEASIRERAVARLHGHVRILSHTTAIVVVGLMQGLRSDEPSEVEAKYRIEGCLKQVAAFAENHNVPVVLEPVNHQQVGFNNTAAEAARMVKEVGSPALGYMLDTMHMNIEEKSVLETIREHGSRIRHFHLCETNGGPFGSGSLEFPKVLETLEQSGYDHFVSVKVYRKAAWDEAARHSAQFLGLRP
jgi:sugar phosphate isomerase/epimerase